MNLTFETEREEDGRWLVEVPELPGVMAYGATEREAVAKAEALARRVLVENPNSRHSGESREVDSHLKCNSCWQKTSAGVL